jgi:NAD-dependent dihydropyrimidine dehydrogenase PreA subunit
MAHEPHKMSLPQITMQRCTGCGLCVEVCPTRAVELARNRPVIVRPEACTYCDVCESYCPEGAIERPFVITFD